jgi:hypothetical protein
MMCYTLLHKEDPFRSIYEKHPEWKSLSSLFELESVLYRMDEVEASDYETRLDVRLEEYNRKLGAKRQSRSDKKKHAEKLANYDSIFAQLPIAPSFEPNTIFPNNNSAHLFNVTNSNLNAIPKPQFLEPPHHGQQPEQQDFQSVELQQLQQRLQHQLQEELSKSQEVQDMEIIFREEKPQDEKPDYIIYDSDIDDITSNDDDSHIGYEGEDENEDEKAEGDERKAEDEEDVVITSPLLADVIFFDDDDNDDEEEGEAGDEVVPRELREEIGEDEEYNDETDDGEDDGILRLSQPFQS